MKYLTIALLLVLFAAALPAPARADYAEYYWQMPTHIYPYAGVTSYAIGQGYFRDPAWPGQTAGILLTISPRHAAVGFEFARKSVTDSGWPFTFFLRVPGNAMARYIVDFYDGANLVDSLNVDFTVKSKTDVLLKYAPRKPYNIVLVIVVPVAGWTDIRQVTIKGAWGLTK
jgi:hypothetical protein